MSWDEIGGSMTKKIMSLLLTFTMVISSGISSFALSEEMNKQISGNALLIGDHLFELDSHDELDLDSFMNSVRSIEAGSDNVAYYKDSNGKWFEIVADEKMNNAMEHTDISNEIAVKNGELLNTDPSILTESDLMVSPSQIVENVLLPGTFDTEVTVTIKSENNAKFATNISGTVDTISSASLIETAPSNTTMSITRVDDKNIKLKLVGTSSKHTKALNGLEGSAENEKDYNNNGIYGDIKFLMLSNFFSNIASVKDDGQYVVLDVIYNDGVVDETRILNSAKSDMFTIENVDYGVLVLNTGTIGDYEFTLNDATLRPSKVNDSGSIVKFEMNRSEVALVKVTSKEDSTKVDTISIGSGNQAFTEVVEDQDPDRVLVSGPVSYFDYYLVDYDEDGQIRSQLEKTTFDTENEGVASVDETVPALTLSKERTPVGEDVILSVASADSAMSKQWMANVYEVVKDYDSSVSSRVPVQFRMDAEAGTLSILGNSTAINDRNGHHEIVIKSNGFNDIHANFELIESAGEIYLSPNFNWWANNELLFELQDFNYAITNPIYEVYLDGEKLEGDCEEYHVVSNLIRLENDALSKLTVGEHSLLVKIHGFEDYTKTFTLENAPNGAANPTYGSPDDAAEESESASLKIDAVSAATGSIGGSVGSGDSSEGGGGGGAIRANVIYNFDHIANAFILKGIEMNTPYSDKLINWWHSFTKDAVIKNESPILVDYQYYKNSVGINGNFKTFDDLYETMPTVNPEPSEYMDPNYDKPDGLYLNRPYSVKNMLHDSLMGETYAYSEVTALESPSLSLNNTDLNYGDDIVIAYVDGQKADDWADALVNVKVNSTYLRFEVDEDEKTISFKDDENSFVTGDNLFVFTSEGFTTQTLKIALQKESASELELSTDSEQNIIVEGLSSEFIDELNGIYLDGKGLFNDEQVGNSGGAYHFVGEQLILRDKLFGSSSDQYALDEQHTLKISANGFTTVIKNFKPEDLAGGSVEASNTPSYVKLDDDNSYRTEDDLVFVISETLDSEYKDAIEEIQIDGTELDSSDYGYSMNQLSINGDAFTTEKTYEIKILAKDYKDLIFEVTINNDLQEVPSYVSFDQENQSVTMGTVLSLNFDDDNMALSDFAQAITQVIVNDITVDIQPATEDFDLTSKVKVGVNTITIKASNYIDKVYTVTVEEGAIPAKLLLEGAKSDVTELLLNKAEAVKIYLGHYTDDTYTNAITEIRLNDQALSADKYSIADEGVENSSANVLTILEDNFEHGQSYSIKIEADGYTTATFDIVVEAASAGQTVPEAIALIKKDKLVDGETLTLTALTNEVKLLIVDAYDEDDYERALEGDNGEIIVDGVSITTDSDTVVRETISGSYKRTLTLDTSAVTNESYSIVLKADGYKEKTFDVLVDADYKEDIPSIVGIFESYSSTVNAIELETGEDLSIIVDNYATANDYKDAITEVEISNDESTEVKLVDDLSINDNITIQSDWLVLGDNTITVKSLGFKEYQCTVTVTVASVPNSVAIFDGDDILDTQSASYLNSEDVIIVLGNMSNSTDEAYINAITAVKVDGNEIFDHTTLDVSIGYSTKTAYSIPSDYFEAATTKPIVIEAKGYESAAFEITIAAEGAKLAIPAEVGHTNSFGTVHEDKLFIPSTYQEAITKVTFDGNDVENIPYDLWKESIGFSSFFTSNGGSYGAGTYTITVEAEGYETYEGTITFE